MTPTTLPHVCPHNTHPNDAFAQKSYQILLWTRKERSHSCPWKLCCLCVLTPSLSPLLTLTWLLAFRLHRGGRHLWPQGLHKALPSPNICWPPSPASVTSLLQGHLTTGPAWHACPEQPCCPSSFLFTELSSPSSIICLFADGFPPQEWALHGGEALFIILCPQYLEHTSHVAVIQQISLWKESMSN